MAAVDDHHLALAGYEIVDVPDDDKVRQNYLRAAGVSVVSRFSPPRM